MSASLTPSPKMQFFDANGDPLVGGKLYTYAAGTTTPLATYTDSTGGTPNANPVVMNARGEASVWLGTSAYYFELKDSAGSLIWTADNITGQITSALVQSGVYQWLTSISGADTITATANPVPSAYAAGQTFRFVSAGANTGAVTLNIASLGAKSVTKNGTTALSAGDIPSGAVVEVAYDGTRFQLISANVFAGAVINTARATVASAATTADIWGAAGNEIDWTGTTTCTGFPSAPQAGASRTLICAAAAPFTAGTNMLIDGTASGSTITLAANDIVTVHAITTTQFRLEIDKYDGTAVVPEISGSIKMWGGSSAPSGWLQVPTAPTNISRTTYAGIFAAYGTTWGAGDGSTTFGMPYCPTGKVFLQGTVASTTAGQIPAHTHPLSGYSTGANTGTGTTAISSGGTVQGNSGSTGSGTDNLPAGVGVMYIIKI